MTNKEDIEFTIESKGYDGEMYFDCSLCIEEDPEMDLLGSPDKGFNPFIITLRNLNKIATAHIEDKHKEL